MEENFTYWYTVYERKKKSLVQLTYGLNVSDEEHQGRRILEVLSEFCFTVTVQDYTLRGL